MSQPVLELSGVDYSIGGQEILQGVSLSVGPEETLAILGASGSGKSTLLRVILGLARPNRGRVLVRGRDIAQVAYEDLVALRKRMGIVFQDGALFDSLTVGENVGYYFMEHERQTHAQVEPKVRAMLAAVGLEHTLDMMPAELSGGMRRRVAIARALIYRPDVILYDEPTTGLDPAAAEGILNVINQLKRDQHVASVMVTHAWEHATAVADRFVVIRRGRVAWSGTRRQFVAQRRRVLDAFYDREESMA